MFLNKKLFRQSILIIVLIELISLMGYLFPAVNSVFFIIIALVFLAACILNLEYGLLILLAELFIGSKGYLFFIEVGGMQISIRIAFWLILLSVWLAKFISASVKKKGLSADYFNLEWFRKKIGPYYGLLFIFITWGLVNAILKGNSFNDIFFDVNGWLFFALIFPILTIFSKSKNLQVTISKIFTVFFSATLWLCIKTLAILYIFSHQIPGLIFDVYRWVRESGVGEITLIQGGFYRIFFQSHIFVLIAFFVVILMSVKYYQERSKGIIETRNRPFSPSATRGGNLEIWNITFLVLTLTVNLLSFSRSNWVGLAVGLIATTAYIIYGFGLRSILKYMLLILTTTLLSALLLLGVVKFPYPDPTGGFSAGDLLSKRATQFTGEAALSSRWALFPVVWGEIKKVPILGAGFGATVTYISSDPRVLETSPTGEYTTAAFEWGWLDIWYKLGIMGIVTYIAILFKLFITGITKKPGSDDTSILAPALAIGLVVVATVSFFSPYMNHPLGIGYLLLATVVINNTHGSDNPKL